MSLIKAPSSGRNTEYVYDFENRLIEVDYTGMVAQYKYDPFGRRIEKNVNGDITTYFYDGPNIITEYNGNGNVKNAYLHSLAIDDPLAVQQGGQIYYYHKDGLGSITEMTDASGNTIINYRYNSFGEIISQTGNLNQPFTFTGREYDAESGLYYYRARYYDPRAGRFLTKDPNGFTNGDIALYIYVKNNPLSKRDEFGLADELFYRNPVPDPSPSIKNRPPNYRPSTIPPEWHPPFPSNLCETKCYLILFTDFYGCNIKWSMEYLEDPGPTCAEEGKEHNEDCKRGAYNYYTQCIQDCSR